MLKQRDLSFSKSVNIDNQRRRVLLNYILAGVSVLSVLAMLTAITTQLIGGRTYDPLIYFVSLGLLAGIALIYALNRMGYVIVAGALMLIVLTAAISLTDEPILLISGQSLFFFVIPIMMASFLLHAYTSFIVAGIVTIDHLILWNTVAVNEEFSPFGMIAFYLIVLITWLAVRNLVLTWLVRRLGLR